MAVFFAYNLLTGHGALAKMKADFEDQVQERPYKLSLPQAIRPPIRINADLTGRYRGAMEKYYLEP